MSEVRTEIELEIQNTLGTKRKAKAGSYNQGKYSIILQAICLTVAENTAFFGGIGKNDSDNVNNSFRAQDKRNIQNKRYFRSYSPVLTVTDIFTIENN